MSKSFLLFFFLILASCGMFSSKKNNENESITAKKRVPVNIKERALSEESGGLFSSAKKTDALGQQNVMWKAAIKVLDFVPLSSADYDGGMIVTDWYSGESTDESIKINISFNSNEIKVSSIHVKSFKKTCKNITSCKTSPMSEEFNKKIRDQILEEVKNMQILKNS